MSQYWNIKKTANMVIKAALFTHGVSHACPHTAGMLKAEAEFQTEVMRVLHATGVAVHVPVTQAKIYA